MLINTFLSSVLGENSVSSSVSVELLNREADRAVQLPYYVTLVL